ncbi:16S rRNA processing protein RimM [Plasmodium fragile]|uniref:16S rRNA processing protein RimM n=1 Tax=Plasmodium fragile TaxID=5857 RepID=A0A0D9QI01_PLAFR|nr:16S rRNA processing protein RimM [Plasmodium fragile]KJP86690.1 16S rRNA processing protein RimM [Plasmodium fragile]
MKRCVSRLKKVIAVLTLGQLAKCWLPFTGKGATWIVATAKGGYAYTEYVLPNSVVNKPSGQYFPLRRRFTTRRKKNDFPLQRYSLHDECGRRNWVEKRASFLFFRVSAHIGEANKSRQTAHANRQHVYRVGGTYLPPRSIQLFSSSRQCDPCDGNRDTSPNECIKPLPPNKTSERVESAEQKEEEECERVFLTDTKYYKRSKYSKAGFIKKKTGEERQLTIGNNGQRFHQKGLLHNELPPITSIESEGDLLTNHMRKGAQNEHLNLPQFFITNYYADKNRPNELDLTIDPHTKESSTKPMGTIKNEKEEENYTSGKQSSRAVSLMNEFTVIGEIVGVHGLQGWLKVVSFTTFNDIRFKKNMYRYLFMNTHPYPLPIKLTDVKESLKVGFLYVKIEGINSRTDALKLKSCLICDDKRKFPSLSENQYISTDLLNFHIFIFNDLTNTCIGKVLSFISKYDYICKKSTQSIAEDLIKIQIKKDISLQKVFHIISAAQMYAMRTASSSPSTAGEGKPVRVLINRKGFSLTGDLDGELSEQLRAEEYKMEHGNNQDYGGGDEQDRILNDEPVKGDKNYYDSLDNFEGCSYKKIYKCDFCEDVYEDLREASEHESSHFPTDEELLFNASQASSPKENLYEVDRNMVSKLKPIDYFFIPIVKDKTIRSVNYELKQMYLDVSTIFLLDDQKKT